MSMDPLTSTQEHRNASFLSRYKFTILSLCIILIALIPLVIISKNTKKPATQSLTQKIVVTPTPTVAPLTQDNAVPTIDAVDTKVQAALDQSNKDIQAANQVDTTQDNTAGL